MHFGDSIFIFLLALVLFGPKKLPEIGRTIGKLLAEFRRASNEFKFQIQEELRNMEDEERRKKLAEQQAQNKAAESSRAAARAGGAAEPAGESSEPRILPPSTGAPVSTGTPYAAALAAEASAEASADSQAEAATEFQHDEATAASNVTAHTNGNYGGSEPTGANEEAVRSGAGGEPLRHG
jgi:sec-independent protein translocase protein TatB